MDSQIKIILFAAYIPDINKTPTATPTLRCRGTLANRLVCIVCDIIIIIIIITIIASHEDEMNDKYNDKLCTSYEVIQ